MNEDGIPPNRKSSRPDVKNYRFIFIDRLISILLDSLSLNSDVSIGVTADGRRYVGTQRTDGRHETSRFGFVYTTRATPRCDRRRLSSSLCASCRRRNDNKTVVDGKTSEILFRTTRVRFRPLRNRRALRHVFEKLQSRRVYRHGRLLRRSHRGNNNIWELLSSFQTRILSL